MNSQTRERQRTGFVMIDAILSIAILGLSAVTLIALLRQSLYAITTAYARERDARAGGDILSRISSRDDSWLDAHIGTNREGNWLLRIESIGQHLTQIQVLDTLGRHVLVETILYHQPAQDSGALSR